MNSFVRTLNKENERGSKQRVYHALSEKVFYIYGTVTNYTKIYIL